MNVVIRLPMNVENKENFPIYELELRPQWWAMLIISGGFLAFFLPVFLFSNTSFKENLDLGMFSVLLALIILPTIFGFMRKRVRRVFKIDAPHQILIIETYWHAVRVYKSVVPFQEIRKFGIKKQVGKKKGRTTSIKYLALKYHSGKTKVLSLGADEDFVEDYALQLNNFLEQYTSLKPNAFIEVYDVEKGKKILKRYLILFIILVVLFIATVVIGIISLAST